MTMSTATMETAKETAPAQVSPTGQENVPSGFILKLFQMVNGAPDEVITWTPDGGAFVIGSDINRLESETLPQYFRHNRFQSLVRQLNFYSFRKINRERNVWIYKHNLFHRDRPEDLYLVRRRTCPGLDGRKQRFSRFSSSGSKGNTKKSENNIEADDSSSVEEASANGFNDNASTKRAAEQILDYSSLECSLNKRARGLDINAIVGADKQLQNSPVVDTSIVRSVVAENSSGRTVPQRENDEESEDDASLDVERDEKLEMMEQSMVVSDVAMRLEEFARKARQERGVGAINTRTRRGGAGVVTPPYVSSYQASSTASSLLTYDDEYETSEDLRVTDLFGIHSTSSVVTDDDSAANENEEVGRSECLPRELLVAPVKDTHRVRSITERLLRFDDSAAAIAGFCMTTAPNGDPYIVRKILQLIDSCEKLAYEFDLYRAALQPLVLADDMLPSVSPYQKTRSNNIQIWVKEASRHDAIRDFKTFAVNCVQKVLKNGSIEGPEFLVEGDEGALEHTADVWLKSVGVTDGL